jgi:hypothetical protein
LTERQQRRGTANGDGLDNAHPVATELLDVVVRDNTLDHQGQTSRGATRQVNEGHGVGSGTRALWHFPKPAGVMVFKDNTCGQLQALFVAAALYARGPFLHQICVAFSNESQSALCRLFTRDRCLSFLKRVCLVR